MTFNPQDILSKIRRKEITPSKTFQVNNDISEKKGHFASRSSSSSGNIFPQNFEQPPVDNEYIGNLLKKIQSLENKVNSLELELVESKKQTNLLKIEKVHLENQLIKKKENECSKVITNGTNKHKIEKPHEKSNFQNPKKGQEDYFSFNENKNELKEKLKKNTEDEHKEQFLKTKEKNHVLYGGAETKRMNTYKTPGYLKTEILENILKNHPEIGKPIISIKINEEDFN